MKNLEPPTEKQKEFVKEIVRFIDAKSPEIESKECYRRWISDHVEEYRKKKNEVMRRVDREYRNYDRSSGYWAPELAHDNPGLEWGLGPEDFGIFPWGDS